MKQTITIMYFRDHTGKIQIREISIGKIGWLIAGLIFLVLLSILSVIFIIKLYADRNTLGSEIVSIRKEKESLEQRINAMEATIHEAKSAPPTAIPIAESPSKVKPAEKPADLVKIKPSPVKTGTLNQKEAKPALKIALQNLKTVRIDNDNQIVIAFDIIAINNMDAAIDGYVITIGYYGENHLSVPEGIGIQNGLPDNFQKGNKLSINLQQHIEHILPASMENPINRLMIFVYSEQGELLAKKEERL